MLTVPAPVRRPVCVALTACGNRAATDGTKPAPTVDREALAPAGDGVAHLLARGEQDRAQLLVGELADRAPGVDAGGEAGLALEDVADASEGALVEQGVAERTRGIAAPSGDHGGRVELGGEKVRAEHGKLGVAPQLSLREQAHRRTAELDRLPLATGEHRPGGGPGTPPGCPERVDVPTAAHPQVAVQD